jgi:hypothetical protein
MAKFKCAQHMKFGRTLGIAIITRNINEIFAQTPLYIALLMLYETQLFLERQ